MSTYNLFIERAEKAIDVVFSDQSVSQGVTRDSLEGLIEYIQAMLETLEEE